MLTRRRERPVTELTEKQLRRRIADASRVIESIPDSPPHTEMAKLLAVMEGAARDRQAAERVRSELAVTVEAAGLGTLPAAVEVAAYRIVSEALTNVVKHAGASRCTIRLVSHAGALEVEVTDDGAGIGEDVSAGVGLLSLRERAEELGGRCEVSCPEVGGTRVWAWLPRGEGAR